MMSEVVEKSCKTTEICKGSQVPYPTALENFFTLSREYQTQFSCAEEYLRCRKFKFNEIKSVEEFIASTMFFNKCIGEATEPYDDGEGVVKNVTKRMIGESKKYNCEVHFNVIWVYYFVYRDEKINCLPIFKIHKFRNKEAVYVDAFSNVFQTWNCCIDGLDLEESLLCIPMNGEYCFDESKLNLEFMLSKSCQRGRLKSHLWVTSVSPMLQGLQNWVMKIRSGLLNNPEINSVVQKYLNMFMDHKGEILKFSLAILAAFLQPELKPGSQLGKWAYQAAKIIMICLTELEKSESILNKLQNVTEKFTKYWKCIPEGQKLLEHFKKPSRNWIEIFEAICLLIKKIQSCNGPHVGLQKQG